ncbi:hypothetical protein GC194_11515 [bacterium]|nr:hypothetical protein [bacterium]
MQFAKIFLFVLFVLLVASTSCNVQRKAWKPISCPSFHSGAGEHSFGRGTNKSKPFMTKQKRHKRAGKKSSDFRKKALEPIMLPYNQLVRNLPSLQWHSVDAEGRYEIAPTQVVMVGTENGTAPQQSSAKPRDENAGKQTEAVLTRKPKDQKSFVNPKAGERGAEGKTAWLTGLSILIMAVLAGISMPALGSLGATFGLVGILLLDVLVSLGVHKLYKNEKPGLAKASSGLRLVYSAFLATGIGFLFAHAGAAVFNSIWGWGLIAFGLHLITLGLLYHNKRKKWLNLLIKSLLILAGLAYLIQYVGILLVASPVAFAAAVESILIAPMILGEMGYAISLLLSGGWKLKNTD